MNVLRHYKAEVCFYVFHSGAYFPRGITTRVFDYWKLLWMVNCQLIFNSI